jgi:hypothetical protein
MSIRKGIWTPPERVPPAAVSSSSGSHASDHQDATALQLEVVVGQVRTPQQLVQRPAEHQ